MYLVHGEMNHTLFHCGFKKEVVTNSGRRFDVSAGLPKAVQLEEKKQVKCEICGELFAAKKYLDTHVLFKHPSQEPKQSSISTITTQFEAALIPESDRAEDQGSSDANDVNGPGPGAAINVNTNNRRGRSKRKSYTIHFKLQTIQLLDTLKELKTKRVWDKVAEKQGISKSLVVKWNKDREKIISQLDLNKHKKNEGATRAITQRRQLVTGKVKTEKYPLAENRVVVEFKLRRAKGCKVSKLWLKRKMIEKIESCYGKDEAAKFRGSDNWFQRFKKRNKIAFRRTSNKKKCSANDGRETIQLFHRNLRQAIKTKRRRSDEIIDAKHGRWLPTNRYNVDQVPLPFVVDQEKTYEIQGSRQVWVSQPSSGLDKRQATLQLCIRAEGEQNVKPAIVFRGKGNVSKEEKVQYDKGVDVYFQKSAWMDSDLNMQWVEKTLVPGIGTDCKEEKVLFADNVGFQLEKRFHNECRKEINTIVYLLPANHTDKVQPIDAGCGKMLKTKIGQEMDKWLEDEDNLEMWHDKMTASHRRVLMTKWASSAWKYLTTDKAFFRKLFQKTGCLMTVDGTNDDLIKPQGLEDYEF